MINIGITTYNRKDFLTKCLDGVIANTKDRCKIFVYDDASDDGTGEYLAAKCAERDNLFAFTSRKRMGITYGFNSLWRLSEGSDPNEYFCYLQDDTIVTRPNWVFKMIAFANHVRANRGPEIGLMSGHDAPEHPTEFTQTIDGVEIKFKRSIRATNMMAPYWFWHKIGYVPLTNLDGSPRGFPGPVNPDGSRGKGSNMDLYITGFQSKGIYSVKSAGPNCSWNLGTYCMVVPGLVKHVAESAGDSTWGNPNTEGD